MTARDIHSSHAAEITWLSRRTLHPSPHPASVRRPQSDEPEVRPEVRRMVLCHSTYGLRRVRALVLREGWQVNRMNVHRLMHIERSARAPHFPPPRLQHTGVLTAPLPNVRWYTYINYVETTDRSPCILTSILDACNGKILTLSLFPELRGCRSIRGSGEGGASRVPRYSAGGGPGRARLRWHAVHHPALSGTSSLPRVMVEAICKKCPEDNGMVESYHGKLKMDYFWVRKPTTYCENREVVEGVIRPWNEERPYSSLGYLTPNESARMFK